MIRSFLASMDHLNEILHFFRKEIAKAGFKEPYGNQLELALEEAVVNIIKYAYPESPGKIHIQCQHLDKKGIKVILTDNGIPFNPTLKVTRKELEEISKIQPLGGYGLFLIFTIMDVVEYEFKDGNNILTLTKMIVA